MRKFIFILLVSQSLTAFSQFSDSFSDGLFLSGDGFDREVNWTGDIAEFIVNESRQLQLSSADNHSPSQLKTHSYITKNASWEFYVNMGFNPSSSNYTKIYIVSDEDDFTGELNGLFIRIGYADKNICLIQSKKGGNNKILIQGEKKRLESSSIALNIKATMSNSGEFKLYSRLNEESDFTLEGSCKITESLVSNWFGVVCFFTITRRQLFFFDDFSVKTEEIDDPEPNPNLPGAGDILISEIMANPGSDSGNPEYVELYNATDKTFQLSDCLFFYDDKSYSLPEKAIAPKSYFVLCKTTATEWFGNDVNVNGVTSFPILANTGKLLMLGNTQNELVSWFEYSDQMYKDNAKKTGGWSLECIDLGNRSNTAGNWSASVDPSGGTPGKENSVKSDNP
ncbi:MAG: lamin tail domain-containing protein, partial [Dysgonamonadaceae bacterium]|nr:lamin tail domain-containing protein [Dysgonamonadaceae bacterium]